MAYAALTRSFGASHAGASVHIFETSTGTPAVILAASTGGIVSKTGIASLDASGNLSVYVDNTKTFTVNVTSPNWSVRQLVDNTVSLTTLNATTGSLSIKAPGSIQLVLNIGTATTPPTFQLEGSPDGGTTWYAVGSPLAAVASSTVQATASGVNTDLVRARVSVAGNTVVAGYVMIRAL
jgi:hypothetical protein